MNFVDSMELHLGKLVNSIREGLGMTEAELARRSNYSANNVNKFKKRKHFYTDALDVMCIVLHYNFYLDKAKEIAAKLDPSGVSEPSVPYESANWKVQYKEQVRITEQMTEKMKMMERSIDDKTKLIKQQEDMLQLLRNK